MKGKSGYITGIYNPNVFNGSNWKINYCESKRCPSQSKCQNSDDIGDMKFVKVAVELITFLRQEYITLFGWALYNSESERTADRENGLRFNF